MRLIHSYLGQPCKGRRALKNPPSNPPLPAEAPPSGLPLPPPHEAGPQRGRPSRRRREDDAGPAAAEMEEEEVLEVVEDEKAGPAAAEKRGPTDTLGSAPAASGHYELPW